MVLDTVIWLIKVHLGWINIIEEKLVGQFKLVVLICFVVKRCGMREIMLNLHCRIGLESLVM